MPSDRGEVPLVRLVLDTRDLQGGVREGEGKGAGKGLSHGSFLENDQPGVLVPDEKVGPPTARRAGRMRARAQVTQAGE